VVFEPTRSAWVVVAAHFRATGAKVVMIAPEQSADLRKYYRNTPRTTGSTRSCSRVCRCFIRRAHRGEWARAG